MSETQNQPNLPSIFTNPQSRVAALQALMAAKVCEDEQRLEEIVAPLHTPVPEDLAVVFTQGKKVRINHNTDIETLSAFQAYLQQVVQDLGKLKKQAHAALEQKKDVDNIFPTSTAFNTLLRLIEGNEYTLDALKSATTRVSNCIYPLSADIKESKDCLQNLTDLIEGIQEGLKDTYSKRCEAVFTELETWAKGVKDYCGTEDSSKHDCWGGINTLLKNKTDITRSGEQHRLLLCVETMLGTAEKDRNSLQGYTGRDLLRQWQEAHNPQEPEAPAESPVEGPVSETGTTFLQNIYRMFTRK